MIIVKRDEGKNRPLLAAPSMGTLASAAVTFAQLAITLFPVGFVVWAWIVGNGVPYFKDNNESILSYVQAVNIWRYPLRDTWLLTTSNTDAGALGPPIIYAHNPNLPRFIHAALLGLGISSLPLSLLIIAVSGTLVAMLLLQSLAGRLADGAALSLVLPLTLVLDSSGFLTWAVNTYRVMAFVLLWATLLLVVTRSRAWISIIIGFTLFYFEYAFALLVTTTLVTFAVLRLGRASWRPVLPFLLGAGVSLLVFGVQVLGYYGVDGAWSELLETAARRGSRQSIGYVLEGVLSYKNIYGNLAPWLVGWSLVSAPFALLPPVRRYLTPCRVGLAQVQIGLLLGCLSTVVFLRDYFVDGYLVSGLPCLVFPIAVGVATAALDVAAFAKAVLVRVMPSLPQAPLALAAVACVLLPNFGQVFRQYPQLAPEVPLILSQQYSGAPFVGNFIGAYLAFSLTGASAIPSLESPETFTDGSTGPYEPLRAPDGRLYYLCIDFIKRGAACNRAVSVYQAAGQRLVQRGSDWAILELLPAGSTLPPCTDAARRRGSSRLKGRAAVPPASAQASDTSSQGCPSG